MPIHEFLVCTVGAPEAHRKKEGDVLCVRPHGWDWGSKEIDEYLIVLVEDDRSTEELDALTREGIYEDGAKESAVSAMEMAVAETAKNNPDIIFQRPKKLSKNRLKMPLDEIKKANPEVDLDKARDPNLIYQPFKTVDKIIEKFNGVGGNWRLYSFDVDAGINPKAETVLGKATASVLIIEKAIEVK